MLMWPLARGLVLVGVQVPNAKEVPARRDILSSDAAAMHILCDP